MPFLGMVYTRTAGKYVAHDPFGGPRVNKCYKLYVADLHDVVIYAIGL